MVFSTFERKVIEESTPTVTTTRKETSKNFVKILRNFFVGMFTSSPLQNIKVPIFSDFPDPCPSKIPIKILFKMAKKFSLPLDFLRPSTTFLWFSPTISRILIYFPPFFSPHFVPFLFRIFSPTENPGSSFLLRLLSLFSLDFLTQIFPIPEVQPISPPPFSQFYWFSPNFPLIWPIFRFSYLNTLLRPRFSGFPPIFSRFSLDFFPDLLRILPDFQ